MWTPSAKGPVIELGPGTGPVTEALVAQGIDPARLILLEFDPTFCRLLRQRYPAATVVQGDAYSLKRVLGGHLAEPAAAVVSGLPLFTKPLKTRLKLVYEAFALMLPGAPFVQFTYATVAPDPQGARPRPLGSLRAHLDEHPAGAHLGLPQGLKARMRRRLLPGRAVICVTPQLPDSPVRSVRKAA